MTGTDLALERQAWCLASPSYMHDCHVPLNFEFGKRGRSRGGLEARPVVRISASPLGYVVIRISTKPLVTQQAKLLPSGDG